MRGSSEDTLFFMREGLPEMEPAAQRDCAAGEGRRVAGG
jgi:hypothetical protein